MKAALMGLFLTMSWFVTMSITAVAAESLPPVFLTLSVTTHNTVVETRINGTMETFLSGGAGGSLVSSVPINFYVHEGENVVEFSLSPTESQEEPTSMPRLLAILELHRMGEIVDTLLPGDAHIFVRELENEEASALVKGMRVAVVEKFVLDNDLFTLIRVTIPDPTE